MKKVVCTWLLLISSAIVCYAQYDRVSVSLSVLGLNANEDFAGNIIINNVSSMKIIKRESADYHTRVLSLSSVSLETGNKPLSHQ